VLASDRAPGRNSHADGVGSVDESGSRVTLDDCELHRASPRASGSCSRYLLPCFSLAASSEIWKTCGGLVVGANEVVEGKDGGWMGWWVAGRIESNVGEDARTIWLGSCYSQTSTESSKSLVHPPYVPQRKFTTRWDEHILRRSRTLPRAPQRQHVRRACGVNKSQVGNVSGSGNRIGNWMLFSITVLDGFSTV